MRSFIFIFAALATIAIWDRLANDGKYFNYALLEASQQGQSFDNEVHDWVWPCSAHC